MTSPLEDLYQEVILEHQRSPRNFRAMPQADRMSEGLNPLCGDRVTVYLTLCGDAIQDVSFQGVGCAICTSSASLMTEQVHGMSVHDVERLFGAFHGLLTDETAAPGNWTSLGKLRVFEGVRQFPVRVKCATLPWHTLRAALAGDRKTVSTE